MALRKKVNKILNNSRNYVSLGRRNISDLPVKPAHGGSPDLSDDQSGTSPSITEHHSSLSGSWDDCDFAGKRRQDDTSGQSRPLKRAKGKGRQLEEPETSNVVSEAKYGGFNQSAIWDEELNEDELDFTNQLPYCRAPYSSLIQQAEEHGVSIRPVNHFKIREPRVFPGGNFGFGSSRQFGDTPTELCHAELADEELALMPPPQSKSSQIVIPAEKTVPVYQVASSASSWEQQHIESQLNKAQTMELASRLVIGRSNSSLCLAFNGSWEKLKQNPKSSLENVDLGPLSNSWASLGPLITEKRPGTPWEFVERARRGKGAVGEKVVIFEPCHLEVESGHSSSLDLDIVGEGVGRSR